MEYEKTYCVNTFLLIHHGRLENNYTMCFELFRFVFLSIKFGTVANILKISQIINVQYSGHLRVPLKMQSHHWCS